jgi:hypothetical protein
MNLSEQEQIRRQALDELRKLGVNPYPAAEYKMLSHRISSRILMQKRITTLKSALPEG